MKNPNVLDYLDVKEYAQTVGQSQRLKVLDLIKSELRRGFQEWLKQYLEPSREACFYLMIGESTETLCEGRIVKATVRRVQKHRVTCVLEMTHFTHLLQFFYPLRFQRAKFPKISFQKNEAKTYPRQNQSELISIESVV